MKSFCSVFHNVFRFYYDGFRNMSDWGRRAWLILLIKLFIIFAVLKLFFFPDFLGKKFNSDTEKSSYVRNQILNLKNNND
jgi:hypothetical protein